MTHAKSHLLRDHLQKKPHSYADLAEVLGLQSEVVARHIRALRASRLVHVSGWLRRGGQGSDAMLFSWGDKPDVKPPPGLSVAERAARSRARKKQA